MYEYDGGNWNWNSYHSHEKKHMIIQVLEWRNPKKECRVWHVTTSSLRDLQIFQNKDHGCVQNLEIYPKRRTCNVVYYIICMKIITRNVIFSFKGEVDMGKKEKMVFAFLPFIFFRGKSRERLRKLWLDGKDVLKRKRAHTRKIHNFSIFL